jgi:tRNA U34 5-carboxymethylaminomethyl modifying GTPase MnmE/TrmE
LIFDNYTATRHPSDVLPASSRSKTAGVAVDHVATSSSKNSSEDLEELRQQLQSLKKQLLMMMEQSRKSSEREKTALRQAQDAIAAKEAAVSEAEKATTRENLMLDLMNEASADMSGMLLRTRTPSVCPFFLFRYSYAVAK